MSSIHDYNSEYCSIYSMIVIVSMTWSTTPKLRIKLRSYDVKMLEASIGKVVSLLSKSGATIVWPVPMPKKRRLYTVQKNSFVNKSSREQFERITYSRLIDVTEVGPKTMEYMQNIIIPVGVLVDVKVY